MIVQGNEFTCTGSSKNFNWLKEQFESKFEITAKILGPELGQECEIRVLNHVLRWEACGIVYEPDQRHAEMVVRELGLETAGSVLTLGTRVESEVGSSPDGILGMTLEEESEDLEPQETTWQRGAIILPRTE